MPLSFIFFFNDTATTEIYTLSLHDALPISKLFDRIRIRLVGGLVFAGQVVVHAVQQEIVGLFTISVHVRPRSEEHTSELQSHLNLVCRLLLEKKTHYDMIP